MKFKNYNDLKKHAMNKVKSKNKNSTRIVVVLSSCSLRVGADKVLNKVRETIQKENIENTIVEITGCMGICSQEPLIIVYDSQNKKYTYNLVTCKKAQVITITHGLYDKPVTPWLLK